jgi:hypothetical protein
MFARQPISRFAARVPKRLFTQNISLFLEYRTKALYGAPDVLPSIVRNSAELFMKIYGERSEAARSEHIRTISLVIVKHCQKSASLLISPSTTKFNFPTQNNHVDTALLVGIMLDKATLVSGLLSGGANPWDGASLLGKPLVLAATKNNAYLLTIILLTAEHQDGSCSQKARSSILVEAICKALRINTSLIPNMLLHWHLRHVGDLTVAQRNRLFEIATESGSTPFLRQLLNQGFTGAFKQNCIKSLVDSFRFNQHAAAILALCFDKKLVSSYTRYRRLPHEEALTLLDWAIEAGRASLVRIVLSGDRSIGYSGSDSATSFRKAIKNNDPAIVKLLLQHGFDPEGDYRVPEHGSTMDISRKDSAVYHILHKAILNKIKRQGDDYDKPNHWVWNAKKQKDELIAYSFTAPEL